MSWESFSFAGYCATEAVTRVTIGEKPCPTDVRCSPWALEAFIFENKNRPLEWTPDGGEGLKAGVLTFIGGFRVRIYSSKSLEDNQLLYRKTPE